MITKIISGNFSAEINGDLNESGQINIGSEENPKQASVGDVIREAGLTYIVQRDGLSSVYKELLKKGEKRNTVAFSQDAADKFKASLEKALAQYGTFNVAMTEHVPTAEASPMVRATSFVDSLMDGGDKETQLRATLGVLGLANAADADRQALIDFANSKGLGIQPPREKKAA